MGAELIWGHRRFRHHQPEDAEAAGRQDFGFSGATLAAAPARIMREPNLFCPYFKLRHYLPTG
jgi:hypothetical protein